MNHDIVDITFLDFVEGLYPGWAIYSCEARLADETIVTGTIQGDGVGSYALETFEPDES
mgnify:CR=1 FL=1